MGVLVGGLLVYVAQSKDGLFPHESPVICRPRGNPSLKPQGTDSSGAPARFARFVNVRCCEIMARLNSSFLPNPGLSTIGGATSAEVRNIRRSMVDISSRNS